jgi:hypothetical protein
MPAEMGVSSRTMAASASHQAIDDRPRTLVADLFPFLPRRARERAFDAEQRAD